MKVSMRKLAVFKWTLFTCVNWELLHVSTDGGAVNYESLAQRRSWQSGGVWVGERRAETAHQSTLRTPFPPTSCKCSASHSGRQESTGSHRVRIQQTYFFLLIWAIAASIDWAKAQCSYRRGGERSANRGGPGTVNVAPTGESNAPSCFKRSSTLAAQGNGAERIDSTD